LKRNLKMAFYEHVLLARPEVSRPQVDQLIEQLTKIIQDNNGQVTKQEYWGLRPLAYAINKNSKAHYALLNIDAPSSAVAEMERQMRFNESILRFLTTRVDVLEDGPSAVIQSKAREDRYNRTRRDDRDGGGRDNRDTVNQEEEVA
jgi:small subunit ribosomal protein S6